MAERRVRFPGRSWNDIEALPETLRWAVYNTIFSLLDEPAPTLANPFSADEPLPGAYELHLPADRLTIWYVVTQDGGAEWISIQLVRADT